MKLLRFLVVGLFLPATLSVIVYFGFATNYTRDVFSESGFRHQYEQGIYKYRVLGRVVTLQAYDLLRAAPVQSLAPKALRTLDPRGDPAFYFTCFLVNTLFVCLATAVFHLTLQRVASSVPPALEFFSIDLPVIAMAALMALTAYVVTPYDALSYCLLALGTWLIVKDRATLGDAAALCVVTVLASLTRETAALIPALYLAVNRASLLRRPWPHPNREQWTLLAVSAAFVLTYAGLRVALGTEQAAFMTFLLVENLTRPHALLGVLFLVAMLFALFGSAPVSGEMRTFALVSLPYTLAMLLVASTWEMRLWTPLLLVLIVLKLRALPAISR